MYSTILTGSATALGELRWSASHSVLGFTDAISSPHDELSAQIFMPRKRLGLMTSRCSVMFEKNWPVDILASMLAENNLDGVRAFYKAHGTANASAMCFQLATSASDQVHAVSSSTLMFVPQLRMLIENEELWTNGHLKYKALARLPKNNVFDSSLDGIFSGTHGYSLWQYFAGCHQICC